MEWNTEYGREKPSHVDVLIIGSGFSGIGLGIGLKRAGFDSFLILERGPDVAGTWRVNTYPGCACDVPSHLYSFSREKNPGWSRMYATQPEIQDYLRKVTDRHGLRDSIRFDSEVFEAIFDEDESKWRVTTTKGHTITARVVTEGVTEVRDGSVVTADGLEREVDVLIYATGFRTLDFTSPVRFVGPGGADFGEMWKTAPRAYLGVATAGFPNLFFITGPNSRVANDSIVFMIEAQVRYVVQCLEHMRSTGATSMCVRPEAQALFNTEIRKRAKRTVFMAGCTSWYLDEKGDSPVLWPGFSSEYWWKSRRIKEADFVLA